MVSPWSKAGCIWKWNRPGVYSRLYGILCMSVGRWRIGAKTRRRHPSVWSWTQASTPTTVPPCSQPTVQGKAPIITHPLTIRQTHLNFHSVCTRTLLWPLLAPRHYASFPRKSALYQKLLLSLKLNSNGIYWDPLDRRKQYNLVLGVTKYIHW